MSLSTLQAQLAALNSSSTSTTAMTTTTTTSKHHTDRMGRGIQYSVQQGSQQPRSSNHSTKYQPTLLYASTRMAADVPQSTVQQQYERALQQLTTGTSSSDTYPQTLQYLSSMLPSNTSSSSSSLSSTNVTQTIRQILLIVSSLLSECCDASTLRNSSGDATSSLSQPEQHEYYLPCLYILEYFIRQYQIHQTSNAIDLLWCLLPVSHSLPILFHRCLLLGDWTNHHQSYAPLRRGR